MIRRVSTAGWIALGVTLVVLAAGPPAAAQARRCVVRSYKLNDFKPQLDGQWQGIRVASDGNVYFASSTHSAHHGAAFFKYDPRTQKVTMLCKDITTVCGEDPEKTPQPKIHSDVIEHKGWLYFCTHHSGGSPGSNERYPGSHVVGYEMATGTFRDLGIVQPNFTCYSGIGVDPVRSQLYVYVTPVTDGGIQKHGGALFFRLDIASGRKEKLGVLARAKWNHCFYLFVDRRGDCWFTNSHSNSTLFCARAETGKLERYEDALPPLYSPRREERVPEGRGTKDRWWSWAQPLPDGERCVFTQFRGGMLWTFDARNDVRSGKAFKPVKWLGDTGGLAAAYASNRYYWVRNNSSRRRSVRPELLSVAVETQGEPVIINHGAIEDPEGRNPWRLPGMDADGEGKVYMVGDWRLKEGERGTHRYGYDRRTGQDTWRWLNRGEFFAVADVGADLAAAGK